jgi:iron(II)-dependent oxidoreductase
MLCNMRCSMETVLKAVRRRPPVPPFRAACSSDHLTCSCCSSGENVWGTFNRITQRDAEQIRRVATLLRFLGPRGYLQSPNWVPHSPTSDPLNLFASYWPLRNAEAATYTAAWTIVNRALKLHTGSTLELTPIAGSDLPNGTRFFDLVNGVEIFVVHSQASSRGSLHVKIERYGAVLATTSGPEKDPQLKDLMIKMSEYAKTPLASLDPTWHYEKGARVPVARVEALAPMTGMTKIPGGPLRFEVRGIEIEGGGTEGDPRSSSVNPYGECDVPTMTGFFWALGMAAD